MTKNICESPFQILSSWPEILKCLLGFPKRKTTVRYEDISGEEIEVSEWAFRGVNGQYDLRPAIEWEFEDNALRWTSLEGLSLSEFKARARAHLTPPLIPEERSRFIWLALMQHYGIPTRLLDFTYSPFVALYFAIRNCLKGVKKNSSSAESLNPPCVRLWAVDVVAVKNQFRKVAWASVQREESKPEKRCPVSFTQGSDQSADVLAETASNEALIEELLSSTSTSSDLRMRGCVGAAPPPAFNPRLANQQGLFLFNCVNDLDFRPSLDKMMKSYPREWCKAFDIPTTLARDIEGHLFQMNIHEQSLFPDMEGLAGLIRQKMRLHWGPIEP